MWSMDWAWWANVCTGSHPSPQSNEFCRNRNLSRAGLSLYLSPARQQQVIKHIIFQRSVHFSYRLAFYVLCTPAQGENSCVGAAASVSLEGERENSFRQEKWSRMPNAASAVPAKQTRAADQGLPQLLHYHNTRKQHLACCYCSNLKTDWRDLQVLSLSSLWPPWPLSSLSTFRSEIRTSEAYSQTFPG